MPGERPRQMPVPLPWRPSPPSPLHEIPLSRLMCWEDAPPGMLESWERETAAGWPELEAFVAGGRLSRDAVPSSVEGYSVAVAADAAGQGCAAAFDGDGAVVGGVFRGNVHVYPGHRGRGIGAELVAAAFAAGLKRPGDFVVLSPGGRATRRSAHRKAVEAALARGLDVPDAVMEDYPDLVRPEPPAA